MSDLWLKHIRQEGLVVSHSALTDENIVPVKQTSEDTEAFKNICKDFWLVAEQILDWPSNRILRENNLPDDATCRLTEMDVTLRADAALKGNEGEKSRLLIKVLDADTDPDKRTSIGRWSGVTEQQAFERHLRDCGVQQGLLVTPTHYRLTYSPQGETPGFLEWRLEDLKITAGREMLAGLKLLLGKNAIWGGVETRLDGILKRSRENQNIVSSKLADQVLGALYTLLRGFTSEQQTDQRMRTVAAEKPDHFYEGLLTVLMRLVFVLYAEDRELMPSSTDERAKEIYEKGYSVRRLFSDLESDAAQHPDTMDDRYGAWGRLLALFNLVHDGAGADFMHRRRGKLFNPKTFPFLLAQFGPEDQPDVLPVSDKCIHDVLKQLLMLDGERLSYKTLDVEQIGSVYETVMGFTIRQSTGASIALKSGKGGIPAYVDLQKVAEKPGDKRKKFLADEIDYVVTDAQNKQLKTAGSVDEILAALESKVDERGSPGKRTVPPGTIILQPTDERRKTGSHYTPRALTAPIVREALEPIVNQLGNAPTPDQILELKVCDPAMGSGAFLVETCRALGEALQNAWVRNPELLPDDARQDPMVFARREVAKRCLYGVDKNHMATDLAKLSLWLVTLSRDEDFSFLDHALKTGDSLVGLTTDQITYMTWQDGVTKSIFPQEVSKIVKTAREDRQRIRSAPDNVTFEQQTQRLEHADQELEKIRLAGDAVISIFFSQKKPKDRLTALSKFQDHFAGEAGWESAKQWQVKLASGEHPIHPFHWQIEFPEVFEDDNPGFDAMVGNPPFAGKNTITNGNRSGFLDWLKVISPGAHGNADLVAHFFRRAYGLIRDGGTMGLIATNTIGQGDTRESGLRHLLKNGGEIYRATRRLKWPGEAAVVVSTVHMSKAKKSGLEPLLDGRPVSRISAFLREGDFDDTPIPLADNDGCAFIGTYLLGMGFTFDDEAATKGEATSLAEMKRLIDTNPKNAERIKPYLGGSEINNDPEHKYHRYVIDFEDFPLKRNNALQPWAKAAESTRTEMLRAGIVPADYADPVAADWPDLLEIVERLVKPERDKIKDEFGRRMWWRFLRSRPELHSAIQGKSRLIVTARVSPNLNFIFGDISFLYNEKTVVFPTESSLVFLTLSSRVHDVWARVFTSTLKDDLNYSHSDCFANFAFFNKGSGFDFDKFCANFLDARAKILRESNKGLTNTYNRFHEPTDRKPDIIELRRLHGEMDDAVLRAYGWDDLADMARDISPTGAAPRFLHQTYEPEFAYQKRYHWPAWFRDKVLARLLELNKERAAAEKAGKTKSKDGKMKASVLQLDNQGTLL